MRVPLLFLLMYEGRYSHSSSVECYGSTETAKTKNLSAYSCVYIYVYIYVGINGQIFSHLEGNFLGSGKFV